QAYYDKTLELQFKEQQFSLTDSKSGQVVFSGLLNRNNQATHAGGTWKVAIFSQDQFQERYLISKQPLPATTNRLLENYSVAEKGKMTGILGLNYEGQDKAHITQVLNAILQAYRQQNVERRSAE